MVISLPYPIAAKIATQAARRARLEPPSDFTYRRGVIHRALIMGATGVTAFITGGRDKSRPYEDYAMHMVRHDHERVDRNSWVMAWQFGPGTANDLPCTAQVHRTILHVPKDTDPVVRADRYEIDARCRVVVTAQPNRLPVAAIDLVHRGGHPTCFLCANLEGTQNRVAGGASCAP